jgi:hypothetical protein
MDPFIIRRRRTSNQKYYSILYVVRKVDEKLGEEMGYETKTAEEEGKDDPFL